MTDINTVYNMAFGLVDNEKEEGYYFLIASLESICAELNNTVRGNISSLDVVITNYEYTLKICLEEIYLDIQ